MKDDEVYLKHILDEIVFLRKISKDRSLDDLKHDDYFAHAVRSAIGVIGEAAKNVPDKVKMRRCTPLQATGHDSHLRLVVPLPT